MAGRYLIANWKMNLPPEGIEQYLSGVSGIDPRDVTIVVAPPYPFLRHVVHARGVEVAGQNCSDHESGAFTGEVSPRMLRECGVDAVILGHSERRQLFHENDSLIARKLTLAIGSGLMPILCIGEDLRVRESGVGVDPQNAKRLFDAFYTTKSGGMGIGLFVRRSIIESHHGRLWAVLNDGPGATFSFSIPHGWAV
jgi:triosephosphate isomerase